MLISVVIPTLDEEANLPVALRQLAHRTDIELIVVDGGSTDRTVEIALQYTPYVFSTLPGRAHQMNTGARHATGDILLFLYADSFLLPGALDEIQRRIIGDAAVGGAFDLHLDSPRRLSRWIAWLANRRARLFKLPCGNQGIFVWRQVFEALGGFPELPIMEEIVLVRRLREAGRLTFLRTGLVSSLRRWEANGLLKTLLVNWWVTALFSLRVRPRQLQQIHQRWLPQGRSRSDQPRSTFPPASTMRDVQ
jgi:rSAM/selenodomain-associated transferase 2